MSRKMYSTSGLGLLIIAFLLFTLMNNTLFSNLRLDLTENSLFTLSDGSKEIVQSIDEPINLYFFFSDKASRDLTALRAYAVRVQELLQEYALAGAGKIQLKVIDPEPFSESEDQAAGFGLQSVPVSTAGDELYFGLVGTNALDDVAIIPFFQPDKEEFLEYEISRLIQGLILHKKPVVGLLTSLPVQGDVNMRTFQTSPAWFVIQQLEQLFSIEKIEDDATELSDEIDLLLVIHPKNLSDALLFSIDQFIMTGGKMLAFVDPLAETDRPAQANPMMPAPPTGQASDLNKLMEPWGIQLRDNMVLGDSQTALSVGGPDGMPVRHLAIVGMGPDNFSSDDVVTADLENINFATAGIIDINEESSVQVDPLIQSSEYSMPLDSLQFQFLSNPEDLQKTFSPTGERYLVAVRLSGKARSAFPDGINAYDGELVSETEDLNVILVADTDILSDRLWVQVQNFFGQQIATPWANNGDLIVNALDNLGGSSALISIRSRGRFTRPFDVVQKLRREAETRYLQNANDLQARLAETERKLGELQSTTGNENILSLSPEQETAIMQFQDEKLRIRKQLRDVRHQLNKDIDTLGSTLKFLNIALVPLLLTMLLLAVNFLRMSRSREG
ncbi:MAG: Gldg family protein [Gammaproteobacteria bacterium]|nr:Gldg family protein [Gammaproteobacteria bacterium]